MVCCSPMMNTLTLHRLQRFLLVNRYGTNKVKPETESEDHITQWFRLNWRVIEPKWWRLKSGNDYSRYLTSIVRDPVHVNGLLPLFILEDSFDLIVHRALWVVDVYEGETDEKRTKTWDKDWRTKRRLIDRLELIHLNRRLNPADQTRWPRPPRRPDWLSETRDRITAK